MTQTATSTRRALLVACIALFTDNLVLGIAIPVIPLLPSVVSAGAAWTGVLFSSYAAALVVSAILAGRFIDQHGPKTPLLIGMIGLALSTLMFSLGEPFWMLLVARAAQGVSGGMSWVAALSLIAATTSFDKRGQYLGIAISVITLGMLIGPPLAGLMVERFGTASPFIFATACAVIDGILRIALIKDSPRITDDPVGPIAVLRVPGSLSIVSVIAVGAAAMSAIEPVLPLFLKTSSTIIGILFALAALTGAIANPLVGSMVVKVSPRLLIGCGVGILAASLILISQAEYQFRLVIIGMALLGISAALLHAPATTLISEQGFQTTPPTLGGSFSLYTLSYAGGLAAGPVLSGISVQQYGFTAAMWLTAAVLALLGAASLPRLPRTP